MQVKIGETVFFDPGVIEDPFAYYQAGIAEAPVHQIPGTNTYLILSYDALAEATSRVEDFSNDFGAIMAGARSADPAVVAELEKGWPQRDTLLTADPPVHTRFRKLVNLAFSMKRVDAMESYVRSITNDLIDAFIQDGSCEFVKQFAVRLPVAVIAEQLGMTRADTDTVKRWSDAFADRLGGMISKERELECAREVVEFQHYMKKKLDERRAGTFDDLLADLVNARIDGERPLDDSELLSIIQQIMVAGNETTTSTLAGGMLLLLRNPAQMAKVRANPDLIPNMVEEMLRLESPSAGLWRVIKKDTELAGVQIPAGSMAMVRFAAANRDPAKYENPDSFEVDRKNARTHVAFGRGIHICVGNMLARKELTVAFQELLKRLDDIHLIEEKNDYTHVPNMLLRGLKHLHIGFKAMP
jgi:cytochrome P450